MSPKQLNERVQKYLSTTLITVADEDDNGNWIFLRLPLELVNLFSKHIVEQRKKVSWSSTFTFIFQALK